MESFSPGLGQKKKSSIILVDDEQSILTELEIILCRTYDVKTFVNPELVEEYVDNNDVDLIVCDEMMPELRGSELLSRLHKNHPDVCKIVLSGQAEKNDVVKAINEGRIFSFLFKPVNRQQLLNVIEKGIENRQMRLLLELQNTELKDLNDNLEKKVKERTTQLIKAHKRLEQLDENKMAFLIYLSYEMSSPLDRIRKLVTAIFSYFGVAGQDLEPVSEKIMIQGVVNKLLKYEDHFAKAKALTIENLVEEDATVEADPKYLEHILKTLIHNGVVFSQDGATVTLITEQGADGKIRFIVKDSGRGFLEEDKELIFKPFLLPPEKRSANGFGLNLPLAKIMVDAMGGTIIGESSGVDQGATFTLTL